MDRIKSEGLPCYADDILPGFFFTDHADKKSMEMIDVRGVIEGNSKEVVCDTLMALANRAETCTSIEQLKIPVLIMVGDHDTLTPPAKAEYMQLRIAGSTIHHLKDAGHLSNLDNPEEFNRHLLDFLKVIAQERL